MLFLGYKTIFRSLGRCRRRDTNQCRGPVCIWRYRGCHCAVRHWSLAHYVYDLTVCRFVAYPIDTLRFRMQCEMKRQGPHGNQLVAQTALQMWRSGGLKSYYRGLLWGLVGQYPYSALDLTIFEYTKQWYIRRNKSLGLDGDDAQPSSVVVATIGGFSGAVGASVVWPLNILRTRLQTQGTAIHPQTYTGIIDAANQLLNKEGARGFLKGITPNLIKVVPSVSITYVVYNKMKRYLDLP